MILDTSAVVAVLTRESDAAPLATAMSGAPALCISAANWFEAAMVLDGMRDAALGDGLDALVEASGIRIVPVTEDTARRARAAWRLYGKGRHPAALNLGDCFAYALAQERGEPLLFKGEDFARTDVKRAL